MKFKQYRRGHCSVCGKDVAIGTDGFPFSHRDTKRNWRCPGWANYPKEGRQMSVWKVTIGRNVDVLYVEADDIEGAVKTAQAICCRVLI